MNIEMALLKSANEDLAKALQHTCEELALTRMRAEALEGMNAHLQADLRRAKIRASFFHRTAVLWMDRYSRQVLEYEVYEEDEGGAEQ